MSTGIRTTYQIRELPRILTPDGTEAIVAQQTNNANGYILIDDLPAGGGGGSGTVTSVAVSVANGLTVSGSPITSSGTIALGLDAASVRTTLNVEDGATADQTGTEIVAAIDTELGSADWQSGGGGGGSGDLWSDVVDADIIPDGDATRDIGSASLPFAEVHTDKLVVEGSEFTNNRIDFTGSVNRIVAFTGTDLEIYMQSPSLLRDSQYPWILLNSTTGNDYNAGTGDVHTFRVAGTEVAELSNSGLDVTGAITVSTTVDGRDVATDGTKLDTIETSADVTDTVNVAAGISDATYSNITPASGDIVLVKDTSDSGTLRGVLASEFLGGGGGSGDLWGDPVDASIIPDSDASYDIGSSSFRFNDGYFAGLDVTGAIVVSSTVDGRDVLDDGEAGDNLITLSGVARDATNLGTFTGTTITDSSTVKTALQELETAVEGAGGGGGTTNNYSSISAPQLFNPDASGVSGDTDDFTLANANAVALVTLNGKVLDDSEYSLVSSTLTVAPDNGFTDTGDEVLVFQHSFAVTGGVTNNYAQKSSAYTVGSTDHYLEATTGSFAITLLTAVGRAGQLFIITNSGTGIITVETTGSENINGESSLILTTDESVSVVSNGSDWRIV